MKLPSVTFVIAARNAQDTIAAAVDSALNQEYDGTLRIIVVDDASDDGTLVRIPPSDRVHVIQNERRLGRSGSRNKALELVNTDFIAIQDADDISLPNRLQLSIPLALDRKTVVGTQLIWHDERSGPYAGSLWPTTFVGGEQALANFRTPVAHPSMLIPTELMASVGGYSSKFPVAEDLDLMLRVRRHCPGVQFTSSPEKGVIYCRARFDSLYYGLNASYWRERVALEHTGRSKGRFVWVLDAAERYARQRLRFTRSMLARIFRNEAVDNAHYES